MRVLVVELQRIFQENPKGILAVLAFDILEIALLSSNPLVIGLCIDSFFVHDYSWFCVLIILQVAFIVVRVTNKVLDTRFGGGLWIRTGWRAPWTFIWV